MFAETSLRGKTFLMEKQSALFGLWHSIQRSLLEGASELYWSLGLRRWSALGWGPPLLCFYFVVTSLISWPHGQIFSSNGLLVKQLRPPSARTPYIALSFVCSDWNAANISLRNDSNQNCYDEKHFSAALILMT